MRYYAKGILLTIEFFVVLVVVINLIVWSTTRSAIFEDPTDAPVAEAALVPGAALNARRMPAPIFMDRIRTAVTLYREGKVEKVLISGDNSSVAHNEVDNVRLYLVDQGIPEEDIFLDHAGFDTYSSMYRARTVFGASRILIVSQSFHLPRAVFIARSLGLEAYGVSADEGHILFNNYVREVFANVKAILDLSIHRSPKFLGEPIPIQGDGSGT
jgi:SanA protein